MVKGKYCCLNSAEYPIEESWAIELVKYFDEKIPLIENLLKYSKFPQYVRMFTRMSNCSPGKYDTDKMQFTPNPQNKYSVRRGNKGFLTHEAAHFVQSYGDIYYRETWAAEAIADYARIALGWDNIDKKEYPCGKQHFYKECCRCGADFLIWVNQNYLDKQFIIKLNKSLQDNVAVNLFLKESLSTTIEDLYLLYSARSKKFS